MTVSPSTPTEFNTDVATYVAPTTVDGDFSGDTFMITYKVTTAQRVFELLSCPDVLSMTRSHSKG